jgi:YHS domain-containing protein
MKTVSMLLALAVVSMGTLATQPGTAAAAKATPKAAAKATTRGKGKTAPGPKLAVCCVCAVKEGKKTPEPVKASLKYRGKTYYFCNLQEKAEFISNPSKYAMK